MRIVACFREIAEWPEGTPGASGRQPAGTVVKINPLDLVAMEAALRLRDRLGGTVTALSLGRGEEAPARALRMGADQAVLIEDAEWGGRDWQTASLMLARAASRLDFDLILCGAEVANMDDPVGPALAEHLGVPIVGHAVDVASSGPWALRVTRQMPKGVRKVYEVPTPCVVTAAEGLAQPRYVPIYGRSYRQGLARSVKILRTADLGIPAEALAPRAVVLGVGEFKPRTRRVVKLSGLSLEEKLKLLSGGGSKTPEKRQLVIGEPERAARELLRSLAEWIRK